MHTNDTIIVTGSAGFIGNAVVSELREQGYKNIIALTRRHVDLLDSKETDRVFTELRPSKVIHCAGLVYGILGNMNNKAMSYYENCLINTNVVQASHSCGVKKIVGIGTGAVYPDLGSAEPLVEADIFNGRPHHSENSYAHAKRGMLAMLESYGESFGMSWAFPILCNVYGPKDNFDEVNGHVVASLIHKFYEKSLVHESVEVWGTGTAKRDFMYVGDVARAIVYILESFEGAINVGSGEISTIADVVDHISSAANMPKAFYWNPNKPNGQDCRMYNLTKLSSIGFKPKYDLQAGISKTWSWYKCQRESSVEASLATPPVFDSLAG